MIFYGSVPAVCLHTLPHLAPPTLRDLQPHQHENVSSVCVRAQSPPGLALVPCALSAVDKGGRKMLNRHTKRLTFTNKPKMFEIFRLNH